MIDALKYICIWLLLFSLTALIGPTDSSAFEYDLGGGLYQGFFAGQSFWDPYARRFDRDDAYAVTSAYADMSVDSGTRFSGFITGAVDWVHDFKPESQDDVTPELIHAFAHYAGDRISADIGKQPFLFGRGLVFDADEPGLYASWTISESYYMDFRAARAFDASPLVSLTAGYRPGFLETVEIFGMYMKDEDNGFADLLNRQIGLDLFSGDGDLFWIGMAADIFVGNVYLSGIGIHQYGRMHVVYPEGTADYNISAYLLDVEASYNLTPALSASAFLFAASGDRHPGSRRFHAFVSPFPYNTRADIFFSGGIDGHDIFEGFSLAGIRPAGVVAPGMTLTITSDPKWLAKLSTAAFFPQAHSGDEGSWYGWETDLSITRTWEQNVSAYLLLGLFGSGDMLKFSEGNRPDTIFNVTAGMNLWF